LSGPRKTTHDLQLASQESRLAQFVPRNASNGMVESSEATRLPLYSIGAVLRARCVASPLR
jgi:hypothetical protein